MADRGDPIAGVPAIPAIPGSSRLLERIGIACLDRLTVSGVSVSVATNAGTRMPVFASDAVARRLENLQVEVGEGPSVDLLTTQRPISVDDLQLHAAAIRWPAFTSAALSTGARALFAYPLQLGAAQLGGLLMYRPGPGGFSPAQQAAALRLADAAFYAVLEALSGSLVDEGIDGVGVEHAWAQESIPLYSVEVHQAAGMIMGQLGISIEQATVRLRAHAFAQDRQVIDVAREIIARKLTLDDDNGLNQTTDRSPHD